MASQISHIIYAKRYLDKCPSPDLDRDLFMLGSVFPDVRRVDERIKRKDTHLAFQPLDLNFSGLNSFLAGWKFHLYTDMRREEILRDKDFYSLKKNEKEKWLHPCKMVEDEMLYDTYNNWEKLVLYFNNPPRIDTGLSISREAFELWYAMVAKYIEKKPDKRSMHIYLMKQHGLPDKVDRIIETMESIEKNKRAVEILKGIVDEIV